MGQEPNIRLSVADLPRAEPQPDPPRRWRPTRPGMVTSPDQRPDGPLFGHPGPDAGWAYRVIRAEGLPEDLPELQEVVAQLMIARASHFGRAPTPEDLEVALAILGYGVDSDHAVERRRRWLEAAAHEKPPGATALAEVDPELLVESAERVRYALGRHP